MRNQIKLGAVLGYLNMAINIVVTLLYVPLMLRLMGQSEYGLYSLVASIIAYLSVLDMGFGNAMVRFVSRSQAKEDNEEAKINGMFLLLYSIIGVIALVIGVIIFINAEKIFGASLSTEELSKAKILMIISLINVALSFPLSVFTSYVTANEKFVFLKAVTLLKTISTPLIMIPLLFYGFKSIAMTSVVCGLSIFTQIITLVYCFKKLKMKIKFKVRGLDKSLLKEIGAYSFFVFLNIIVDSLFNNTDQVILGIVSGTIAVSVYAIANQITSMNMQCSTIISGMFLPRITKLLEEKDADKKISDLFIKVSRIQLYIMFLILSGFIIFGRTFIILWAGKDYIDAFYIAIIMMIPAIVPLTQNICISVIQARNMHQFRSVVYIIIAVLNVIISIPLATKYQGIGAAIGTALANICGQIIIMNIFYYKRAKLDIPRYWRFFIKLALQIAILTSISMFIISKIKMSFLIMLISAGIYVIFYLAVIFINLNDEERCYVDSFFKYTVGKIKRKELY